MLNTSAHIYIYIHTHTYNITLRNNYNKLRVNQKLKGKKSKLYRELFNFDIHLWNVVSTLRTQI